jgi:mRNA interferase MazF
MKYEIFWADLDPSRGSEINKKRPCVVISPDEMNKHLTTVIVAPITKTIKKHPTRLMIHIEDEQNYIALDQIRTISKERLGKRLKTKSRLTDDVIKKLKAILAEMLIE